MDVIIRATLLNAPEGKPEDKWGMHCWKEELM